MQKFKSTFTTVNSVTGNKLYALIFSVVFIAYYSVSLDAQDLSAKDIYTTAPSPQEIADKLYKPRYRSIVINNETVQQKDENLFAMLINFEFDSTTILSHSYPLLDSVGQMMNLESTAQKQIIIEGHTDAIGDDEYNLVLSQRRAQAIKSYLEKHFKVAPERMIVSGKGETELYDSNNPKNEINRRVQFRSNS